MDLARDTWVESDWHISLYLAGWGLGAQALPKDLVGLHNASKGKEALTLALYRSCMKCLCSRMIIALDGGIDAYTNISYLGIGLSIYRRTPLYLHPPSLLCPIVRYTWVDISLRDVGEQVDWLRVY